MLFKPPTLRAQFMLYACKMETLKYTKYVFICLSVFNKDNVSFSQY